MTCGAVLSRVWQVDGNPEGFFVDQDLSWPSMRAVSAPGQVLAFYIYNGGVLPTINLEGTNQDGILAPHRGGAHDGGPLPIDHRTQKKGPSGNIVGKFLEVSFGSTEKLATEITVGTEEKLRFLVFSVAL